ncbi:hypothetical protein CMV30_07630 [Nibricoccus aquaticus]|uniref:Uncharacterized protein n=1 Tax=Nibricoccus aquaticus TaxID=2576891 RepID=A0A290QC60_9BACT|nr:hypothetical protein [Nibricoccus aquaticus]ATC63826.1 hypothetical protein CMV30_07630 [Nibricoccus aquaticus]
MSAIDEDDLPPTPKEKLSKAPSWIMVGFVIGCVFAYVADRELEKRRDKTPAPSPAPVAPAAPAEIPPGLRLSQNEIEAIFTQAEEGAVWENDITEIVVFNTRTGKFSDLIEVMRSGPYFYYRSITRLTRPLITAKAESGALILFTETDAGRAKRLESIPSFLRPAPPKLEP